MPSPLAAGLPVAPDSFPTVASSQALASVTAQSASPACAATALVGTRESARNLDLLLEIELRAMLRFGQRKMALREVLQLNPGSVVDLDRRVEEPVELLVDGRVIARGQVVVIDGNYGLRITEVGGVSGN
jgi:flagellar motor switch protein FliN